MQYFNLCIPILQIHNSKQLLTQVSAQWCAPTTESTVLIRARILPLCLTLRTAWVSRFEPSFIIYYSLLRLFHCSIAKWDWRNINDLLGLGYVWLGCNSQHCCRRQCRFGYPLLSPPLLFYIPLDYALMAPISGNAIIRLFRNCARTSNQFQPSPLVSLGRHGYQNPHFPLCSWCYEQRQCHRYFLLSPLHSYLILT